MPNGKYRILLQIQKRGNGENTSQDLQADLSSEYVEAPDTVYYHYASGGTTVQFHKDDELYRYGYMSIYDNLTRNYVVYYLDDSCTNSTFLSKLTINDWVSDSAGKTWKPWSEGSYQYMSYDELSQDIDMSGIANLDSLGDVSAAVGASGNVVLLGMVVDSMGTSGSTVSWRDGWVGSGNHLDGRDYLFEGSGARDTVNKYISFNLIGGKTYKFTIGHCGEAGAYDGVVINKSTSNSSSKVNSTAWNPITSDANVYSSSDGVYTSKTITYTPSSSETVYVWYHRDISSIGGVHHDYGTLHFEGSTTSTYYYKLKVTNPTGATISGATVQIYSTQTGGSPIASYTTDSNGYCTYTVYDSSAPLKVYCVASKSGYTTNSTRMAVSRRISKYSYDTLSLLSSSNPTYTLNITEKDGRNNATPYWQNKVVILSPNITMDMFAQNGYTLDRWMTSSEDGIAVHVPEPGYSIDYSPQDTSFYQTTYYREYMYIEPVAITNFGDEEGDMVRCATLYSVDIDGTLLTPTYSPDTVDSCSFYAYEIPLNLSGTINIKYVSLAGSATFSTARGTAPASITCYINNAREYSDLVYSLPTMGDTGGYKFAGWAFQDVDGEEIIYPDTEVSFDGLGPYQYSFKAKWSYILTTPTAKNNLSYTGSSIYGVNNYDQTGMTKEGTYVATNLGTYTAYFTPQSGYCWSDGTTARKTVTWTIGKQSGSLSAIGKDKLTFNSGPQELLESITSSGTYYLGLGSSKSSAPTEWSGPFTASAGVTALTQTNAGTYHIWGKCDATPTSNEVPTTYLCTVTISKADGHATYSPGTKTITYTTGTSVTIDAASSSTSSSISYTLRSIKNSVGSPVSGFSLSGTTLTIPSKLAVGTYTVTVSVTANASGNYAASSPLERSFSLVVDAKSITVEWSSTEVILNSSGAETGEYKFTKVYDGSPITVTASISSGSVFSGDTVNINTSAGSRTNKGLQTAAASLSGSSAGNYSISNRTKTFSVTAATATLPTTIQGDSVAYHGEARATVSRDYVGGTLMYSTDNGSTWKNVTWTSTTGALTSSPSRVLLGNTSVKFMVKADDGYGNYVDSSVSNAVTLTVRQVDDARATVTLKSDLTYTGSAQPLVSSISPHGCTAYVAWSNTVDANGDATVPTTGWTSVAGNCKATNAGTYYVWYYFNPDGNHSNSISSSKPGYVGSVTIKPADQPAPTITGGTWTWDGKSHSATCTSTGHGSLITRNWTATDAGTYTVTAFYQGREDYGGSDRDSNYNKSPQATATITINRAATLTKPTVSSSNPFTYNGSTKTGINNARQTYMSTTGTASAINVGDYTYTATPDSNHAWTDGTTSTVSLSWKINKRVVSITTAPTYVSSTLTYNGNPQCLIVSGSCDAGGTIYYYVSTSSTTPTFSGSNGGTGWTTTAADVTGTNATNYYVWYYCKVDSSNNGGTGLNTVTRISGYKTINKKATSITWNPVTGSTGNATTSVTYNTSSSQTITLNAATSSAGANTPTYSIAENNSGYLSYNNGVITVAKAAPATTSGYVIKLTASATTSNSNYSTPSSVTRTITVKVNKANGSGVVSCNNVNLGSTVTATVSGNTASGTVTWTITNGTGSATISSAGVVTPLTTGTVTINAKVAATANYNSYTATSKQITIGASLYVNSNGWKAVKAVYKLVSGIWQLQSDIPHVFKTSTPYKMTSK